MSTESWQDALFTQPPPRLGNQFRDDPLLGPWLRRTVPPAVLAALNPELDTIGGAGRRRALPPAARRPRERAGAHAVGCLGQPRGRSRREPALARSRAPRGHARARRDRVRPLARPLRAHRAVRQGVPVPPVDRRLHLPARDDRRRRAHAARVGQPGLDRPRRAAPDLARSGAVLDQRPVDDRDHRRLRRRPHRDSRRTRAPRAGGCTAASGSPPRSRRRWRSRSRGRRTTRQAARASRCSSSRCATRRAA